METKVCLLKFIICLVFLRYFCVAKLSGFHNFTGFDFFTGTLSSVSNTMNFASVCKCWAYCFVMPECKLFTWEVESKDTIVCQVSEDLPSKNFTVTTPHETSVFGIRSRYLAQDGMFYRLITESNALKEANTLVKTNFTQAQQTCQAISNSSISVFNTKSQLQRLLITEEKYGNEDFFVNLNVLKNDTFVWADGKAFEEVEINGNIVEIEDKSTDNCFFFINISKFKISCDNHMHHFLCQRNFDKPSI